MTIFNQGSVNPSAAGLPGVYVNVQPPPSAPLTGAPSDIMGVVGTASWGPVGVPVPFDGEASCALAFGVMKPRKFDITTAVRAAQMNGCENFRGVRVTDGTDLAASALIGGATGLGITARYTGADGAGIAVELAAGTKANTLRINITMPGHAPEIIDNVAAVAAANASWLALAAAINAGSALIVASAGAATAAPVVGVYQLVGGSDGAAGVVAASLVGTDTAPRTGMYALRNTGVATFTLADCDDPATFSAQTAFAVSEMAYGFAATAAGETVSGFATHMAGQDNPWLKVIFGDWPYLLDTVNGNVNRMISPASFAAGAKAALGPQNSGLNKPLLGIVGTQSSLANKVWTTAELKLIGQNRGDIILMSSPGGEYPSLAFGRNSSSDSARRQDTYTGMTNYLARSFDQKAGVGRFVGRNATPEETREAQSTLGTFLQLEWDAERIGNVQRTVPYSVTMDNSAILTGVQRAVVKVQYLSVIEDFLVDFTGGATVQIPSQQAA